MKTDIATMNNKRQTTHIDDVSENLKALWVWYALDVMVAVSRRQWNWSKRSVQMNSLFTECVNEGDEALAIQIINLRGELFVEQGKLKRNGRKVALKVGRKNKHDDNFDGGLVGNIQKYVELHQEMKMIRALTPNDELGWSGYLRDVATNRSKGNSSVVSLASSKSSGFNSMVLPED